jgi:hypothetical protein
MPVPPLKDPELLRGLDWNALINDLINHGGAVTDQRVLLFRKATILRGLDMKVNPHFIVVLPSNTGKSEWADAVGIREDKASAVSLIGTADMDGIKPGSLHGAELPFAIDQLEESGAERLLRYLLSFMESGEAVVDNAAQPFRIRGTSIIGFYANPLGDPKNDFLYLLLHLSKNPAAGRRFGLLLYDFDRGDYKVPRIQLKSRSLKEDVSESLRIFRAVEEYARKRLLRLIRNEKVWAWLTTPNSGWEKYALQVIEPLKSGAYDSSNEMSAEYKLFQFLYDFITQGYVHTRGAALYAAIVDLLPRIALGEFDDDPTPILDLAEEYLSQILDMNYESLQNIVENYEQNKELMAPRVYAILPKYLQAIVSACELLKPELANRGIQTPFVLPLDLIHWEGLGFKYFSEVLKILRSRNPSQDKLNQIKELFGLEITEDRRSVVFLSLNSVLPVPDGRLTDLEGVFGTLGYFGTSGTTFREHTSSPELSESGGYTSGNLFQKFQNVQNDQRSISESERQNSVNGNVPAEQGQAPSVLPHEASSNYRPKDPRPESSSPALNRIQKLFSDDDETLKARFSIIITTNPDGSYIKKEYVCRKCEKRFFSREEALAHEC